MAGSAYEPLMLKPILAQVSGLRERRRMVRSGVAADVGVVHSLYALDSLRWVTWFRLHGRRLVLHWIGSDYRRLAAMSHLRRRRTLCWMSMLGAMHLIDAPELAADLEQVGVRGEVLRLLPPSIAAEAYPLPDRPAVLSYLPKDREDFYGRPVVYALARRWEDVPFRIVGNTPPDPKAPPNVEFLGLQQDLDPVYRATSILIRVPPHDSLSAMVLEALARGRDVIYSRPFPHTRQARDEEGAAEALAQHLAEYRLNEAGARHVAENFNPQRSARKLIEVYDRLAS
jgi:glycosyltransferase involved in cell wall biosynthesis